ncbi:hypothetical protein Skr01_51770 [Sphaerisporangium krabiense]|uniref:Neocarzinostatin n=1 Tax=Sphaerisporangium krabiense TaxID=763782 RepID=A0A7W9DT10_9ACTN|nr:enediyne antibiotic chromoprotein [Sphaerisporangium krabiense]MBB5630141.1 hypothetical protein [Sphaerisporangium krabiense]GII65092.1 hypothetical protein Skr01_51770 [Sphaerisporangium krabiense]
MKKAGILAKLGVGAALAFGVAAAMAPGAQAAAPSFSATPNTGLSDGSVVTVSVSGAAANETYSIAECAHLAAGVLACDESSGASFTTDASGAATFPVTVRKTFEGKTYEGTTVGTADCAVDACYLGAGNNNLVLGEVSLSFN